MVRFLLDGNILYNYNDRELMFCGDYAAYACMNHCF